MITNEADLRAALLDGGEIYVDSSNLIALSGKLEVTKPTKLVGGMFSIGSGPAFEVTSSNVEIDRVQILGGMASGGIEATQKLIYAHGTQSAPLDNIVVNQCRLFSSRRDNVWLEWCNDSTVSLNIIKRFYYSGIMLISCDGITIQGNQIFDGRLAATDVYGIAVTDVSNTVEARSKNVTITGNRVHLVDWEGIDTHGGDGVVVTGNVITASPRGIALVTGNTTRVISPENCVVSGNYVDGRGAREPLKMAIWLGGIANVPADGTVTGNHVSNYPADKVFFVRYVDRGKTFVGGNSHPMVDWSPITMDEFNAHGTWPPEYKIDGNTTYVRGAGYPQTDTSKICGSIPNGMAYPSELTMIGAVKGSAEGASVGMWGMWPDGRIELFYKSQPDTPAFFLDGSYEAI